MVKLAAQLKSSEFAADLILGLGGFVTSVCTAGFLWWVDREFGFAFYTLTLWLVIPVGAILSGFAGASGYYAAAWFWGYRPSSRLLLNIVIASVTTFCLVHYFAYLSLKIDNINVSDFVPFSQYLDIAIRSASMDVRFRAAKAASTGELGSFGYVVALLQVIGFAIGGFVVYAYLASKPYCERCSCYLKRTGQQDRFSFDGEALAKKIQEFAALLDAHQFKEAIRFHAKKMGTVHSPGQRLRARLTVTECPRCQNNHLHFVVSKLEGENWSDISESAIAMFVDEKLKAEVSS